MFTPKHPKTRPNLGDLEKAEQLIPLDELVEKAVNGAQIRTVTA